MRLPPEQISKDWKSIYEAIKVSLPPVAQENNEKTEGNVNRALLNGSLECWVLVKGESEECILCTVSLGVDLISRERNMFLYTIYGYKPVYFNVLYLLFDGLKRYAKSIGCTTFIAYTSNKRILALVKALNWSTDFNLIHTEV